jgi:hypothetical protein
MVERDMEEERQNGRRMWWGIERKMLFFLRIVTANKALSCKLNTEIQRPFSKMSAGVKS